MLIVEQLPPSSDFLTSDDYLLLYNNEFLLIT